jgi:serine/threonine-protein kinase HipA
MKLPTRTTLDVTLDFGNERLVQVGRLGLGDRGVVFEQRRTFIDSGLTLHPFFPKLVEQVITPNNPRAFEGLHGVFADSLPDAWGRELLRRQAEVQGVDFSSLTPIDRLSLVGSSGPGALTYQPTGTVREINTIDLDVLAASSLAILEGKQSLALDDLVRLGGSSGGARPKISVAMNAANTMMPVTYPLPLGFSEWIVKFRSPQDPQEAGPHEAAYADMARAAGLNVSETRLLPSGSGPGYFATKRFDRTDDGGRMHMVSAAAILETDWSVPGDYETLLKLTRGVTRDQRCIEDVFRRAVFNFVAQNRDDHWKQHAFLMNRNGKWTVAPSFDLTRSPGPGGEHYLTLDSQGKDARTQSFLKIAREQAIDENRAHEIIEEVVDTVQRYPTFLKAYGLTASSRKPVGKTQAPKKPKRTR